MYTSTDASLFARTKLRAPRIHADVLLRERLSSVIERGLDTARLILISAPAGSGKTTLLASALVAAPRAVAWLALDTDDNDPARFLRALVASLAHALPDSAARVAPVLASGGVDEHDRLAWGRQIITTLVNALPDDAPLVIALDDLHAITDPLVYTLLNDLLERLPDRVALVVATRYDPPLALARLRARRQLVEVRLPDLRFRVEETTTLLNERLQLQLAVADVTTLHAQTDGWVAGLHLLAGALDRISTPVERVRFLQHLHGVERAVFDYLADEVLDRQDPFVRMFLLETAVLPELTPARCAALTGRDDAALILDDLYRRNLFLVALNDEGQTTNDEREGTKAFVVRRLSFVGATTYRYHDLFRAFLLARLERDHPNWLARLYRRAADAEPDMARRIAHLLQAQAWDDAAAAISQVASSLAAQGAYQLLYGWIAALPVEVRDAHAWLLYWLGRCAWAALDLSAARGYFARALAGFEAAADLAGQGEVLVQMVDDQAIWRDSEQASRLVARALACPLRPQLRVRLLTTRAHAQLQVGQASAACADLDAALALVVEVNDEATISTIVAGMDVLFTSLPNGVARFEHLITLMTPYVSPHDPRASANIACLHLFVQLWRGQWDAVLTTCQSIWQLAERIGVERWVVLIIGAVSALCPALRGDTVTADQTFTTIFARLAHLQTTDAVAPEVAALHFGYARMHWLRGNRDEVQAAFTRLDALVAAHPSLRSLPAAALWQAFRLLANGGEAEPLLREVVNIQQHTHVSRIYSDARLLLAHLYSEHGRPDAALAMLTPVLDECARDGTPGFLLWEGHIIVPLLRLAIAHGVHADFAARTLTLLGERVEVTISPRSPTPTTQFPLPNAQLPSGEALTEREIEVLRVLATGASNAEIADRLIISPHTAKRHVANVLAKLDATTRTEAAMRARGLGLLD